MLSGDSRTEPSEAERGAILPMMALLLVVLMGLAAMAVDLGWVFWNSVEIQHGADAAALAGVVYEPDYPNLAHAEALASAAENGYDDAAGDTSVAVVDFFDDENAVLTDSMLRVSITKSVPTFFLTLFGFDTFDLTRTAVAEYVQPPALGSPGSSFGQDPAFGIPSPGFWAQINGSYVAKEGGDRFASQCLHNQFGSGCNKNPEARPSSSPGTPSAQGGYLYAIDVEESAAGLTVEIFDGPVYAIPKRDDGTPGCDSCPLDAWGNPITGNFAGDVQKSPSYTAAARTWFMLYGPDLTPLDTTDGNELLCSVHYDARVNTSDETNPPVSDAYMADFGAMGWDPSWLEFDQVPPAILAAMWDNMASPHIGSTSGCAGSFDRGPGVYVLRVFNEQDPVGDWRGANKFSLRVSSAAAIQPTIYGIGDMVMSTTRDTPLDTFYLARVEERYKGKNLVIELWDVGDNGGGLNGIPDESASVTILDGNGSVVPCEWVATNGDSDAGACVINTSNRRYNDELITITSEIPDDYACVGNSCWWRIRYAVTGQVKETTTWSVFVDGNPLHLVE